MYSSGWTEPRSEFQCSTSRLETPDFTRLGAAMVQCKTALDKSDRGFSLNQRMSFCMQMDGSNDEKTCNDEKLYTRTKDKEDYQPSPFECLLVDRDAIAVTAHPLMSSADWKDQGTRKRTLAGSKKYCCVCVNESDKRPFAHGEDESVSQSADWVRSWWTSSCFHKHFLSLSSYGFQ